MTVRKLLPAGLRGALSRLVSPPGKAHVRRYIRPEIGPDKFFRTLKERQCSYVVLRWFDMLPEIGPGEDIDLLVSDEGLPVMAAMMAMEPGGQPCDVYSVTGADFTTFRRKPYYPQNLAQQVLGRAVWHKGLFRVPCPEDYFWSLAYHAVYHKGPSSGLRPAPAEKPFLENPDHDYEAVLATLARDAGLPADMSLTALDQLLASRGFRPDAATLDRLKNGNEWLRQQFFGGAR